MRLHNVEIGRRKFNVDGTPLIVSRDAPSPEIQPIEGTGLAIVTVGILCDTVILDGDSHDSPEPTPIYDQLAKENADDH